MEIKSFNSRYLDVYIKLPREWSALELKIRKELERRISRGRIEVYILAIRSRNGKRRLNVDKELAVAYYRAMKELQADLGLSNEKLPIDFLEQVPGIFEIQEPDEDVESLWPVVQGALLEAVDVLKTARKTEGEDLAKSMLQRLEQVGSLVNEMRSAARLVAESYRKRLESRLQELLPDGIDEARVIQEVAIVAERSDITEELDRLDSLLRQARRLLEEDEPVGRRLDFLFQEMGRELNTVSAKAGNVEVVKLVVDAKTEIEKLREQAQNLE